MIKLEKIFVIWNIYNLQFSRGDDVGLEHLSIQFQYEIRGVQIVFDADFFTDVFL